MPDIYIYVIELAKFTSSLHLESHTAAVTVVEAGVEPNVPRRPLEEDEVDKIENVVVH